MHKLLYYLVLSTVVNIYAQIVPRARIRAPTYTEAQQSPKMHIPHAENVNLPTGFRPHQQPHQPLLYPLNVGEWLADTGTAPVMQRAPHIPFLRESAANAPANAPALASEPEFMSSLPKEPGTVLETIVYGNWKAEHPLKPTFLPTTAMHTAIAMPPPSVSTKPGSHRRLEDMLMGMMPVNSYEISAHADRQPIDSLEHTLSPKLDYTTHVQQQKFGRRRIPTRIATRPTQAMGAAKRVHINDPLLLDVAKQINESIESTTAGKRRTTINSWIPLIPSMHATNSVLQTTTLAASTADTNLITMITTSTPPMRSPTTTTTTTTTTTATLNWPTDFLDITTTEMPNETKYYNDVLNSAQMHSELSIPEHVLPQLPPQLPLNITHVGVPYEQMNSAEEPTICVPLTVTESTISTHADTTEVVEVERVYCFPMPQMEPEAATIQLNQTETTATISPTNVTTVLVQASSAASGLTRFNLLLACSLWYLSLSSI